MSKRQDFIIELLQKLKNAGISQAFIARKVGLTPQNFNYHLKESPELDLDIYNAIIREAKKLIDLTPEEKPVNDSQDTFEGKIQAFQYPILATVFAGDPNLIDLEHYDEVSFFTYKKNNNRCFALRVNGRSMETTLNDGDIVLVDMDLLPVDGDLVAVKLKNGNQYIKRYKNLNFAFVQLSSDNPNYDVRLIDKNDIVAIFPVVQIVLNIRDEKRRN